MPLDRRWATHEILRGLYAGSYERPEAVAVRKTLELSDRYFEIGAGLGVVTAVACDEIGGDKVCAFEANPELITVIERTASANRHCPEIVNAVLGDDDQPKDFYLQNDFWASSPHPSSGGRRVSVPGRSFDAEMERFKPTYLMLDIEGAEVELLARPIPSSVRAICMETHPRVLGREPVQRLLRHLDGEGFALDLEVSGQSVAYCVRL